MVSKVFRADDNKVVKDVGSRRVNKTVVDSSMSKRLKNKKSENLTHIKAIGESIFLTPSAKEAFNYLRQEFIKAQILRHFDPECHIQIETDASGHAIVRVLSQLSTD